MIRTTFGLIEIGTVFQFIGNPIVWQKVSDFTAQEIDSPYETLPGNGPYYASAISGHFPTDGMVDIKNRKCLQWERILENEAKQ